MQNQPYQSAYGAPEAPLQPQQPTEGYQEAQRPPEYVAIQPSSKTRRLEPFRFALPNGDRHELPNLQSGDMPLEIMETVLALTSGVMDDAAEQRATAGMLAYLRMEQPKVYRSLKRNDNQIGLAAGLIKQWAEHSQVDPKASGSPTR